MAAADATEGGTGPGNDAQTTAWFDVADRATLAARRWMEAAAGPAAILLYDIGGQVFATSAICPHHAAWLSQGNLDGGFVDCPRHMGRFVVATGEQVRGPACARLPTYAVRIDAGRVLVQIPA